MTSKRPKSGDDIRAAYLEFFQKRGHLLMPSASLVPAGDPTLLLTSAGMVPFKPYFTGDEEPPSRRLTSAQKCFRTQDIDFVGDDSHLSFFEMLGNFSVGDYFKKEAIAWAWEFVTGELGLPPERLWVTIFLDDDEAHDLWRNGIGVPEEHIVRLDETDNFWGPPGDEGPCGPCSEIHYDFYPERGVNGEAPSDGSGRFLEIWNLVFIQHYQHLDGSRTPLPTPGIDTGMGLERTAAVMQGVTSAYDTDLLAPIVERVASLAGKTYGEDEETDYAIRVVAEHARSAAFLIADSVVPGNEGRNYLPRRMIRRAIRSARRLGVEGPFLAQVAETVIERMGPVYRELAERGRFILRALEQEEEGFIATLSKGLAWLADFIEEPAQIENNLNAVESVFPENPSPALLFLSPRKGETGALRARQVFIASFSEREYFEIDPSKISTKQTSQIRERLEATRANLGNPAPPGKVAFDLYATYGFPLELTQEIAAEHGLEVDIVGYVSGEEEHSQQSRAVAQFGGSRDAQRAYEALGVSDTPFLGYERLDAETTVAGILADGAPVERAGTGDEVEVVLRETPFYAEGGGQVGDTGAIQAPNARLEVRDTQSPAGNVIVHYATVAEGTIAVGDAVRAEVDAPRRADVMRNHTATHLLHAALREVLDTHVRQAGSLVAPDYLRFDFTHAGSVTPEELDGIQDKVNDVIRRNVPAEKRETTYRDAIAGGALAFFGDRYPDRVRVLEVGEFSYEVCGGTHVDRSGDIGTFRITGESGIGTGLRRIEAVTGRGADAWVSQRLSWLEDLSRQLHAAPAEAPQRIAALVEEVERARRTAATSQRVASLQQAEGLLGQAQTVDGVSVVAAQVSASGVESLREMGDWLRDKLGSGIVVLGGVFDDRPSLVAMVTPDLVAQGYKAGDIVKAAAQRMGGGGGGRADVAQAGGRDPGQLQAALDTAVESIRRPE